MKIHLTVLMLLTTTLGAPAAPTLRCELRGSENRPISSSHLHFLLFSGQNGLRVFQAWNSWGYDSRSFTATDLATKKKYRITRQGGAWDKNVPSTHTLNEGEFLLTDIELADGSWASSPKLPMTRQLHLSVVGEYSQKKDPIAETWTGHISSPPTEVYLDRVYIKKLNGS